MVKVGIPVRSFLVRWDVNKGGTARVFIACRLLNIEMTGFFCCKKVDEIDN
ncbi:hypothetical protein L3i20_v206320 [Paenibacillus sp. L3-i20]|nr:hypothetical protein L3i20_v206320 [Paenibacillus sp. L3-i20]